MRILGIDYGDRRVGLALSDYFAWTASSLGFVDLKKDKNSLLDILDGHIKEYKVETIVVGYPLNMNGTRGPRAMITDEFIEKVEKKFPTLKIVRWDERLTSKEASRIMREMNISSREKGMNDKIAATLILQSYLDSRIN